MATDAVSTSLLTAPVTPNDTTIESGKTNASILTTKLSEIAKSTTMKQNTENTKNDVKGE